MPTTDIPQLQLSMTQARVSKPLNAEFRSDPAFAEQHRVTQGCPLSQLLYVIFMNPNIQTVTLTNPALLVVGSAGPAPPDP